jgi:hypothetical protein
LVCQSEATLRLDFARSTDAPRSITVASDGDDDRHSQVLRSVCRFVWTYWPTANNDRRSRYRLFIVGADDAYKAGWVERRV